MPYPALLLGLPMVTGIGMVLLAAYVWRRRSVPGAYSLAGSLACMAGWCLTHGMEHLATTVEGHLLWAQIQFPSIVLLPVLLLMMAYQYTGQPLRKPTIVLVSIVPAVSMAIHLSDPWTHIYWQSTWLAHSGPLTTLGRVYGPGFWVFSISCYALTGVAITRLFIHWRKQTGRARRRTALFLGSAALPVLLNLGYVFNITPLRHFDVTPYAFAVTTIGMTMALFQYRFQSITPIAWKTVVESMRDCAIVIDTDGRVEDLNAAACEFLQHSHREVIGQPVAAAFERYPGLLELANGSANTARLTRKLDPVERVYQAWSTPVLGRRNREVMGRLLTMRDITDETEALRVLKQSREAAEQAAVAKARFLATMSHEIRTPMNGVMGMADLLLNMDLSEEQREYVLAILESGRSLLHILNDVLDYSKIEAGRMELEDVPFSVPDLLDEIRRLMEPLARKRNLELSIARHSEVSGEVMGDPGRIRQILVNLVGNGLKFTERGGVTMELSARDLDGPWVEYSIAVRDTGIGIEPDRINRLFVEFSQGDASTSRRFGGTGLGLAICRRLATAMKATIQVESTAGKGSAFTLRLKLKRAGQRPVAAKAPVEKAMETGCRVLLAEDNHVNQRVATRMLERLGCEVDLAEDGLEALRKACSGSYDVILMDCEMPGLDGLVATTRLRDKGISTPVIALTASVLSDTRKACSEAGMNDFLSKPLTSESLGPLIRKWAHGAATAADI